MMRILCILLGVLLLALGLISLISPIPGSTFFTAAGLTLLICASPWFREGVRQCRARLTFVDKLLTWIENHAGKRIGGVLASTRPGSPPQVSPSEQ